MYQNNGKQIKAVLFGVILLMDISCGRSPKVHEAIGEVQIGNQTWMAKNFNGTAFQNGDPITEVKSAEEWERAGKEKKPAWCYYQNDPTNGRKYGRIYNWYAINDPRGFAPKGWHVPTNAEWIALETFLGEAEAGKRLKCSADSAQNRIEFCARLGGYRGKEGGFSGNEEFTYMATSTPRDPKEDDVWGRGIHVDNNSIMRCGLFKAHGVYVRLIKD